MLMNWGKVPMPHLCRCDNRSYTFFFGKVSDQNVPLTVMFFSFLASHLLYNTLFWRYCHFFLNWESVSNLTILEVHLGLLSPRGLTEQPRCCPAKTDSPKILGWWWYWVVGGGAVQMLSR